MSKDKRISRLERTIRKKLTNDGSIIFGGYLLPVEILYIVDVWKLKPANDDFWVKYAREQVREGKSNPGWFYFMVPSKDNDRIKIW